MPNDPSMNDPGAIWRNQPTETSQMTLELIQQRARELHANTRRELILGTCVSLMIAALSGYGIVWVHQPLMKALFAVAVAWSLASAYFLNRGMWPAPAPEDAALSTGLASYRREVARRRHIAGVFLLWGVGPAVFPIAVFIASIVPVALREGKLLSMVPFVSLLMVWVVAVFIIRMRDRQILQREIEQLNAVEKGAERRQPGRQGRVNYKVIDTSVRSAKDVGLSCKSSSVGRTPELSMAGAVSAFALPSQRRECGHRLLPLR